MDPVDLFVAYLLLSSLLAWVPLISGSGTLALHVWKRRRTIAAAERDALELLAGRSLTTISDPGWPTALTAPSDTQRLLAVSPGARASVDSRD